MGIEPMVNDPKEPSGQELQNVDDEGTSKPPAAGTRGILGPN